ncbi:hypothetical protein V2J09_008223 [Rumex salicifolius]
MYHPTRPGVRGGRDQFKWDDVKVDKHRENYIGHSLKAPVGRWQKGKDLFWYTKDKNAQGAEQDAMKAEIQKVKEEEEQMMREALGLAPKRASRPKGNRIDKHEYSELVKRGSTADDLGAGHAEAAAVTGLGFARAPKSWEQPSTLPPPPEEIPVEPAGKDVAEPSSKNIKEDDEDENDRRKRRREEKKRDRHDKHEHSREEKKRDRHEKHEKRHSRDSDERRKHRKDKERRRHDSD